MDTIEPGATVRIEYTLTDEHGEVLDTNRGAAPLTYVHGRRQIIPGLEEALSGMQAGEEKQVTVAPESAYGVANPDAVVEVPKSSVPDDALSVGSELVAEEPGAPPRPVRVKEIRDETVLLDLNHPLAGKTLYFDVRVVEVARAA